jgi:hypothetical protein
MNFDNNENTLILEQEGTEYSFENEQNELFLNNEEPQATFEDVGNELSFDAPYTPDSGTDNYEELNNLPKINGFTLIGNKTTEDLGIVGTSMTEIELSTDITNPTEIINYIGKSGTYVAKNAGVLGTGGEPMVVLAKGQFITISNLQELASIFGVEIPDNQNIVQIDARLPDGTYRSFQIIGGKQLKEIAWITSENVNDYVDSFNPNDFINSSYGIYTLGGRLAINSATQTDIHNGYDNYKPITSNNIDYAVKLKGKNYFVDKTEFNTLETDLTTLKTEIETILESVVSINE